MNVNYQELAHLCSDSGLNSSASSAVSSHAPSESFPPSPQKTISPQSQPQTVETCLEIAEISTNDYLSHLSSENFNKMTSETLQKFTSLKINEGNNNNASFESEHCELVNVDNNGDKHI